MEKRDVIIAGGGPAGIVCSLAAKNTYPDKSIMMIKSIGDGVIPCGIPYMFASLDDPQKNALSTKGVEGKGISVVVDEVVSINREAKTIKTKSGSEYQYEKLVLAIGSTPIRPPIPGIDLECIFTIKKSMGYLKNVVEKVKSGKNILILGGGFIGIELADEISKLEGKNIYLVEMLPHLLANSFDSEFSTLVEEKLKAKGVNVLTNVKVEGFIGNGKVKAVKLSNGQQIDIDCAILGIGAKPNSNIAKEAGLDITRRGGIWVDEYMRTSDTDIFAIGDCAIKRNFYTRKDEAVMLASTATAEARIAGANLYQLKVVRENRGTIAIYSTYVDGLALGSAGLTENSAKKENFEIIVGKSEAVDRHPGSLPGASKVMVKLIFSKQSGIIMGGQVAGGQSAGELINIIGLAIQKRVSLTELETLQMATHPYLTPAPTIYPIVMAAQNALM